MFLMVLKQQWPQIKGQIPGARLESSMTETPNMMQAVWTLQDRAQADEMTKLSKQVILPYRRQLAPKSVTLEGESTGPWISDAARSAARGKRRRMTCPAMLFWLSV